MFRRAVLIVLTLGLATRCAGTAAGAALDLTSDVAPAPETGVVKAAPGGAQPYTLPSNLLEYFRARYEHIDPDSFYQSLRETPYGPSGSIDVRGRMTPTGIKPWNTRNERAEAIAMAFLTQEAALLGIKDLGEIEELRLGWEAGTVAVDYARRIGGYRLSGFDVRVTVEADGPVVRFVGILAPADPALYAAAKGPFISEAQVVATIQRDMGSGEKGQPATVEVKERYAKPQPPMILQVAVGILSPSQRCNYVLNAATGEIVLKHWDPVRPH